MLTGPWDESEVIFGDTDTKEQKCKVEEEVTSWNHTNTSPSSWISNNYNFQTVISMTEVKKKKKSSFVIYLYTF